MKLSDLIFINVWTAMLLAVWFVAGWQAVKLVPGVAVMSAIAIFGLVNLPVIFDFLDPK